MTTSDKIALAALIVSVLSFAATIWLSHRAKLLEQRVKQEELRLQDVARQEATKASVLQALQGEKESVGFTALHIAQSGLPLEAGYRQQVILALVQAAVFSGSDRARAVVYAVLRDHLTSHRHEIVGTIDLVEKVFAASCSLDETELDLSRGKRRLQILRKALSHGDA